MPTSVLRISSRALRPLRRDLSEVIEAATCTANEDMALGKAVTWETRFRSATMVEVERPQPTPSA